MIRVLIVEDQRMAQENMEAIIKESDTYTLAGAIANAADAELFCMRGGVDLILMDVCTARDESGIEACAVIKKKFRDIKVIIVTSMAEHTFIEKAKQARADSFWYKDASGGELISVMDRTMAGEHIFPDKTPSVQLGRASSAEFIAKEIEVLRLVCDGLEYSEIAEKLCVSVNTVKTHVSHILQRTGYANKTRLAIAVTNKKFIIPSLPEDNE